MKKTFIILLITGAFLVAEFPNNSPLAQANETQYKGVLTSTTPTKSRGVLTSRSTIKYKGVLLSNRILSTVKGEKSDKEGMLLVVGQFGARMLPEPFSAVVQKKFLAGLRLKVLAEKKVKRNSSDKKPTIWYKVQYEDDIGWVNKLAFRQK